MALELFPPVNSVDLHVHLRGALTPVTARRFARESHVKISDAASGANGRYRWSNFSEFLGLYSTIGAVITRANQLRNVAEQYLRKCAAEGTVYVEFMLSPDHSLSNGITYLEQLNAVALAAKAAKVSTGIEARLIVTCVRHHGPDQARKVAELVAANPHEIVVGFGMVGDESQYEPELFVPAFAIARQAGLKLTAHCGEWRDASSVLRTVNSLGLNRIGHGVSAAQDAGILAELAARKVGFEVCLSSNVALGVCALVGDHPLPLLLSAGCKVSLATDNPGYLGTDPAAEYKLAHTQLGLSRSDLTDITHSAIEMAFCDQLTKTLLLSTSRTRSPRISC